ncbi:hypothetical protein FFLO_01626 [Filobasidium floriforme]|uniref:Selenoprotein O n=1 Tax=Filobasidium floriforme TaxID=5210 RepID=A0A8K0NS61_9TREE|nr:uncharacterized protein HD553DRAFT_275994 [Filobasidium floriforme]KAG7562936.1 hypothetical protein FFLO_01626 [Filobasidium floriforme]KAH8080611.1 hypothetical protein HD553DRAFT_275994 [Filobasidium floriforme]
MSTRVPFTRLPLPSKTLQAHLSPIDLTEADDPDPTPFVDQRRSRTFSKAGHWARVTPLPLAFPYRLPRANKEAGEEQIGVEEWLKRYDTYEDVEGGIVGGEGSLRARTSELRSAWRPELLGVSSKCLDESLPHLDVGNALAYTGQSESRSSPPSEAQEQRQGEELALDNKGQELLDVVSGRKVLRSEGYGPWSSRYAGHQFGQWAGQLGDGRAISILETTSPEGGRQEIQLKGSGRTPFSRSADGLAVLRSGVREYLCAEAMAALQIPTSRSLALLTHPEDQLQVLRENGPEPSSLLARVAPSFVRIGNFEILNPPEEAMNMQFFMLGMPGGGGSRGLERDLEGLRILGEWVKGEGGLDLKLPEGEPWGKKLVMESALRNARMVAAWQVYGFCHGVINTDNVSVLGLTIDYGPYAFMDVYDPYHICNHSDHEGRYDYRKQPSMILFAINQLVSSLAEVIGAEEETGKAIVEGWAQDADEETLDQWRATGMAYGEEVEKAAMQAFRTEYKRLYAKRFGLADKSDRDNSSTVIDPFLQILANIELDFHSALRALCAFQPSMLKEERSADLEAVLDRMVETAKPNKRSEGKDALKPWFKQYAAAIEQDRALWESAGDKWEESRSAEMRGVNPRFVLRQWLLEETIKKLEHGSGLARRKLLGDIMHMATHPFEPYGGELLGAEAELSDTQKEEQRLCSIGSRQMLGFQCSCSS